MQKFEKKELKKKSENLSEWYTDVILKAELADYAPVKGCMVIRPYGYALWEKIQEFMDFQIKKRGVKNAYFPLFIPESFIKKEKDHVEGFSPHMAVVTEVGGEKLKERLIVRPTSETVMYHMYKQWAHSWRDLPILINQWNNIVRWEKRTYLFLRTSEFLWQEGHCAHYSSEENMDTVLWALDLYRKTYQEVLAMYGIAGEKSQSEKFAGADQTFSVEYLMPDGKALQGATSHNLGQNFAKAFDWTVLDKQGQKLYPWQNSWGYSTRSIGGLIMSQSDDNGLILPPIVAPLQVVIVVIPAKDGQKEREVFAEKIKQELETAGIRVELDIRYDDSVGRRFNFWEIRGVPIRLEIGEREVKDNFLTVFRRDNFQKEKIEKDKIIEIIQNLLIKLQDEAFKKHRKFTEDNTYEVSDYGEFKKIMGGKKGFIKAFWCEKAECEEKIKQETKASTRVKPLDVKKEDGKCIYCGKDASFKWYFAQSY